MSAALFRDARVNLPNIVHLSGSVGAKRFERRVRPLKPVISNRMRHINHYKQSVGNILSTGVQQLLFKKQMPISHLHKMYHAVLFYCRLNTS